MGFSYVSTQCKYSKENYDVHLNIIKTCLSWVDFSFVQSVSIQKKIKMEENYD